MMHLNKAHQVGFEVAVESLKKARITHPEIGELSLGAYVTLQEEIQRLVAEKILLYTEEKNG